MQPAEVGDDVLLDVREQDEWDAGHAPRAFHVPLSQVPARLPEVRQQLPAGSRLAVVCRVGGRSASATEYLRANGVDARNVDGGMFAWQHAGLPIVADVGPPRVL